MLRIWLLSISAILIGIIGILPRVFATNQTVVINDILAETYIEDDPGDGDYYDDSDAKSDHSADTDTTVSSDGYDNRLDYTQYSYKEGGKKHHAKAEREANRPATGRKVFIFNPRTLRWSVYDGNGSFVRSGHGSAGRGYCPDIHRGCRTPIGVYHIFSKAGAGFRSTRYPLPHGGAPMPYAMFFSKYYAIHGSNDVPGYNASHGCIRVYPSDARWLNQNFLDYGSTVIVKSY